MSLANDSHKLISKIVKYDDEMPEKLENMSNSELEARVTYSAAELLRNEQAKKADTKLSRAKDKVAELSKDYKEIAEYQGALRDYALLILEERGAPSVSTLAVKDTSARAKPRQH